MTFLSGSLILHFDTGIRFSGNASTPPRHGLFPEHRVSHHVRLRLGLRFGEGRRPIFGHDGDCVLRSAHNSRCLKLSKVGNCTLTVPVGFCLPTYLTTLKPVKEFGSKLRLMMLFRITISPDNLSRKNEITASNSNSSHL